MTRKELIEKWENRKKIVNKLIDENSKRLFSNVGMFGRLEEIELIITDLKNMEDMK